MPTNVWTDATSSTSRSTPGHRILHVTHIQVTYPEGTVLLLVADYISPHTWCKSPPLSRRQFFQEKTNNKKIWGKKRHWVYSWAPLHIGLSSKLAFQTRLCLSWHTAIVATIGVSFERSALIVSPSGCNALQTWRARVMRRHLNSWRLSLLSWL